jgi:PBP1b-binding outer membrane lipoprotein LpoB
MKKLCAVLLVAVVALFVAGCQTHHPSGSREYVPGKGWIHND